MARGRAAAAIVLLGLTACTGPTDSLPAPSSQAAEEQSPSPPAIPTPSPTEPPQPARAEGCPQSTSWQQRRATSYVPGLSDSVQGSMPQIVYATDDGPATVSDAFVDGVVVDVEAGPGFFWTYERSQETAHVVRRNHPRVEMTATHLVVRPCSWVDRSVGGLQAPEAAPADSEDVIRIAYAGAIGQKVRDVREAFVGERIAALLAEPGSLWDYEPGLFSVAYAGELLGVVDDEGVIAFAYSGTGRFVRRDLRGITVDDLLSIPPQTRPDPRVRG